MKDATKGGIANKCKKDERREITKSEEAELWKQGLRGSSTAETLLHTMYFYNGKLFGLRGGEHRLLRVSNITVQGSHIIFDECMSKTFHGGLKDLTRKLRYIEHFCHELEKADHQPCLLSLYSLYLAKVSRYSDSIDAFFFSTKQKWQF